MITHIALKFCKRNGYRIFSRNSRKIYLGKDDKTVVLKYGKDAGYCSATMYDDSTEEMPVICEDVHRLITLVKHL